MHCKVCHNDSKYDYCNCATVNFTPETPCTKECEGKPKDHIVETNTLISNRILRANCAIGLHVLPTNGENCLDCGWSNKKEDHIPDVSKMVEKDKIVGVLNQAVACDGIVYESMLKKPPCQHQWFEIKKGFIPHNQDHFNCHQFKGFKNHSFILVGCILCPEVRIKWEDGEIEVIKKP